MNENNKYRLTAVYLKDYFEGHKHEPITREMLLDMLCAHDICITRKTLLHYIRALREYGMDIANTRGRTAEYYYQGQKTSNTADIKETICQSTRKLF